jgi:glycosyltransferase involved in cell wall biosynthesis
MLKPAKHIALVIVNLRPGIDGAATAMLELMPYVRALGYETTIFNFLTGDPRHRAMMAARLTSKGFGPTDCQEDFYRYREGEIDCRLYFLPFSIKEIGVKHPAIFQKIIETLKTEPLDYLLTVDRFSVFAGYLLGKPGCHFFHSLANIQEATIMHPAYVNVLRGRDVAAVSGFLQIKVKELLGIEATVINPGINFPNYIVPRAAAADAIGFYAGGYPAYKGDEVVNIIIEKMPERRFIIVGRGYAHDFARFPANVSYLGFQHDMKTFYRHLKLVLVPSLVLEGFARIILEAAANGIPAIASNIGGIPEALQDSGILIDVDPPQQPNIPRLAEGYIKEIRRLFHNTAEYEALSAKARLRARQYAAQLEEVLGSFLRQHIP